MTDMGGTAAKKPEEKKTETEPTRPTPQPTAGGPPGRVKTTYRRRRKRDATTADNDTTEPDFKLDLSEADVGDARLYTDKGSSCSCQQVSFVLLHNTQSVF